MVRDDALTFLIYVSREVGEMNADTLASLLSRARRFNQDNHITGMLLYRDGSFMQILEGKRGVISQLFERIAVDPRHTKVDLLLLEGTDQRYFAEWSMGFCDLARPGDKELASYSAFLRQGLKAANAPLAPCIPSSFLKVFAGGIGNRERVAL